MGEPNRVLDEGKMFRARGDKRSCGFFFPLVLFSSLSSLLRDDANVTNAEAEVLASRKNSAAAPLSSRCLLFLLFSSLDDR